ncbi:hypothetical protein GW750_07805 [bacterium]|nr:hypothetical protein [bacterium]
MYYAATKFLLTNEYLVLDNVPALTIPLKYGQTLRATPRVDKTINLTAHDHNNKVRYTYASDIDKIQATDLASMCFDRLQQN